MAEGREMKKAWVWIEPWDKELAVAALESGADAVVTAPGDAARVRELGRIPVVCERGDVVPGKDVFLVEIRDKRDEETIAREHRDALIWLRLANWTVIPLENLLAQRSGLLVEVINEEQTRTMLGILEKGVDGVVINTRNAGMVRKLVGLVHDVSPHIELEPAVVTRVEIGGMGDRVCVDTCAIMTPGEGMLVGNASSAFFLVHAETQENPYVAARPFRVNAGAVHSYIMLPNGRTSYLADLRIGSEAMIVDSRGRTRTANIGRCKVEKRPMLLVVAQAGDRELSVYLQNAETINLTTPEGRPVSVSSLKPGDSVLVRLEEGGRHFGMKIDESLVEK